MDKRIELTADVPKESQEKGYIEKPITVTAQEVDLNGNYTKIIGKPFKIKLNHPKSGQ